MRKKRFDYEECYLTFDGEVFAIAENKKNAKVIGETLTQLFNENEQLKLDLKVEKDGCNLYYELNEELEKQNRKLKDLLKSMADRNDEIWLDNGQIIRLKKVLKGEWR